MAKYEFPQFCIYDKELAAALHTTTGKLIILIFKVLNGVAPAYIFSLLLLHFFLVHDIQPDFPTP